MMSGYCLVGGILGTRAEDDDYRQIFRSGYQRICLHERSGYLDAKGDTVVPPRYEAVYDFREGISIVRNGALGAIDSTGREIIPIMYENMWNFNGGICGVRKNGQWGYVDRNDRVVIPIEFDDCFESFMGKAVVCKSGVWGYYNSDGTPLTGMKYERAFPFADSMARVVDDGRYGFIDLSGREVIAPRYSLARDFSEGLAPVFNGRKWGYVDKRGRVVIPFRYDDVRPYREGSACVKSAGLWGYVDRSGRILLPFVYDDAFEFIDRRALAVVGGQWRYIDPTGAVVGNSDIHYTTYRGGYNRLCWSDEFDCEGALDSTIWRHGIKCCGYEAQRPENVWIENDCMVIESRKECVGSHRYTSACVDTKGGIDFMHGRIEVRAKIPGGIGTWPAIWMLPVEQFQSNYHWGEIDLLEALGFNPGMVYTTVHYLAGRINDRPVRPYSQTFFEIDNLYDDFHTYALEWNENSLDFYFDGVHYYSYKRNFRVPEYWTYDKPYFLILDSAWGGDAWGGIHGTDDALLPQRMYIQSVRYYK